MQCRALLWKAQCAESKAFCKTAARGPGSRPAGAPVGRGRALSADCFWANASLGKPAARWRDAAVARARLTGLADCIFSGSVLLCLSISFCQVASIVSSSDVRAVLTSSSSAQAARVVEFTAVAQLGMQCADGTTYLNHSRPGLCFNQFPLRDAEFSADCFPYPIQFFARQW